MNKLGKFLKNVFVRKLWIKLAAVFLALRGESSPLWNEGLRMLHLKKTRRGEEPDGVKRRMIWFLIAATLPLALAAVLNKYVESL